MDNYKELLAHYDKDNPDKKQFLVEHLLQVGEYSKELGSSVKLGNTSELIGVLHDLGKNSGLFQLYIKGEYKGRVNHSSAGAIMLDHIEDKVKNQYYDVDSLLKARKVKVRVWNLYKEILQYPILSHHGLYDIIDNNLDYRTGIRLEYDRESKYSSIDRDLRFLDYLNEEYRSSNNKSIYDLYYEGFEEFIKIYKTLIGMVRNLSNISNREEKIMKNKALHFYYGALIRLLLSILKEADIYDSSNYYRQDKDKIYSQEEINSIWNEMGLSIENLYSKFDEKSNKSELDIIRTNMANEAYNFSQKYNKGAYKLDMPVGSGKTFAALRYAVTNAKKFKKTRIYYCTAFLSVLEQNADSIRKVVGEEHILEHHSNIIEDYEGTEEEVDKKDYEVYEYLKESWESPFILTTLVQLSNTMFKHRASNIRRFSKLINSVIIIDEIQSLPTKAIFNFNLMTNFLTNIMNCTVIHCTATHPNFDNKDALKYPCNYGNESKDSSIIESFGNTEVFNRVDYYNLLGRELDQTMNTEETINHIKEELEDEMSALIVLNTKRAVSNLYNGLITDNELLDCKIIYLTTNQCPKHRLEIINNIKEDLKNLRDNKEGRKIICVSTKLVEAGVDIDFDLVYRSLAGIDSLIQCGGRCNREGKKDSKGRLFIFKYEDENLRYLQDIQKQRDASETALKLLGKSESIDEKIDIEKAVDYYFHKLYLNEEGQGNKLEYPMGRDETIFNLLTTNPNRSKEYEIKHGKKTDFRLKQGFKTAAMEFDLIKENTISVIVKYKNDDLIDDLYTAIEAYNYHDIKIILKKLQPYTVSIRRIQDYENYVSRELEGEILILSDEAYDHEVGITEGELQTLIF